MSVLEPTRASESALLAAGGMPTGTHHHTLVRTSAHVGVLAIAYVVTAKAGLHFSTLPGNVTVIWPPAGLMLAGLLLFGRRAWPGVAIGSVIVDVTEGLPWAIVAAVMVANTLHALLGAWLLESVIRIRHDLGRLREIVAIYGAGALLPSALAATIGVGALTITGLVPFTETGPIWLYWWMADTTAVLLITPLVLVFSQGKRLVTNKHRALEAASLAVGLAGVTWLVYRAPGVPMSAALLPMTYAVFPFLVWAGTRFGIHGAALAVFFAGTYSVVATSSGAGPFGTGDLPDRLLRLYSFLTVVGLSALMLGSFSKDLKNALAALRRHRSLLDAAFDQPVVGIVAMDERGIVVDCNGAGEAMLRASKDTIIGSPLLDRIEDSEIGAERRSSGTMADDRGGAKGHRFEGRLRSADAEAPPVWLAVTLTPVAEPIGEIREVAIIVDVTGHHRAEAAQRLARDRLGEIQQLERLGQWKNRLLNIASHELKTPLTPIKLQLHMLRHGELGPLTRRQQQTVTILDREVERLAALVGDVLDVSRIQAGHLNVHRSHMDLATLVIQACEIFAGPAAQWDIRLQVETPPELFIDGDADRLTQVVVNLLSNAFRFSPTSSTVTVSLDREGDDAILTVNDEGEGIDPADTKYLFEPFSQLHESVPGREKGTGLGLAICRGIVESHGGAMVCEARGRGHGACFGFRLPMTRLLQDKNRSTRINIPSGTTDPASQHDHATQAVAAAASSTATSTHVDENDASDGVP